VSIAPIESHPGAALAVSKRDLFLAFCKMGLLGFGGVLPWARRVVVEERGWLSDNQFAEDLGLCQVLPGPNVVNFAVVFGSRCQGVAGALLALVGLLAVPLAVLVVLATLHARWGGLPEVRHAIGGLAAAAAGLTVGTALKMGWRAQPGPLMAGIGASGFLAVGLLRWPLVPVVLVLVPAAILAGRRYHR
jgi:chromate transporter